MANTQVKKRSVFGKVLKYLQQQAVENSSSKTYLTPPGREPQQRRESHSQSENEEPQPRTLSEASTAVELRHTGGRQSHSERTTGTRSQRSQFGVNQRSTFTMSNAVKKVQYALDNLLQSYEVYIPELAPNLSHSSPQRYWILYIHGGYFRDPKVDATAFHPALDLLSASSPSITEEPESFPSESAYTSASISASPSTQQQVDYFAVQHHIAGYASINYRLSPHPAYPQDPAEIPKYEMRTARYPEQLSDIHAAIRQLQSRHGFGSNYIVAGHSVGATLAFLAALHFTGGQIQPPKCIVGVNGIYDFPFIHQTNPGYEELTKNAMSESQYAEASPALAQAASWRRLVEAATGPSYFLLSHSRNDGLVVWDQVEKMRQVLETVREDIGATPSPKVEIKMLETVGTHDQIWREGKELARTLREAVDMVTRA